MKPLFTKYGPVSELRVATERDTGRSRGFAFLTMEDPRDAQDAIDGLRGHEMDGREIRVELSRPRDSTAPRGGERFGGSRSDVCYGIIFFKILTRKIILKKHHYLYRLVEKSLFKSKFLSIFSLRIWWWRRR